MYDRWPGVWPKINWPKINWPIINWPKINWPKINWPKITWPKIIWPKINWTDGIHSLLLSKKSLLYQYNILFQAKNTHRQNCVPSLDPFPISLDCLPVVGSWSWSFNEWVDRLRLIVDCAIRAALPQYNNDHSLGTQVVECSDSEKIKIAGEIFITPETSYYIKRAG